MSQCVGDVHRVMGGSIMELHIYGILLFRIILSNNSYRVPELHERNKRSVHGEGKGHVDHLAFLQ